MVAANLRTTLGSLALLKFLRILEQRFKQMYRRGVIFCDHFSDYMLRYMCPFQSALLLFFLLVLFCNTPTVHQTAVIFFCFCFSVLFPAIIILIRQMRLEKKWQTVDSFYFTTLVSSLVKKIIWSYRLAWDICRKQNKGFFLLTAKKSQIKVAWCAV